MTHIMGVIAKMSLIMGQVILDQSLLSALEIEKLNFCSLFGIYRHCLPVLLSTQVSNIGPSWSSCCVCLRTLSIWTNLKFYYLGKSYHKYDIKVGHLEPSKKDLVHS